MADIIGGFQRLEGIGSGGQARVWKAQCVENVHGIVPKGAIVALKIRDVPGDESEEQFAKLRKRVAELMTMNNVHVVRYLGCFKGMIDGQCCHVIVQEYLSGETLKERLARLRLGLDVDEGLRIVREAAEGLSYTADLNIFHRDVKPGNIFICEDGTVKLIDFGVAKQEGETVDGSNNLRGTFNYMAPDFLEETFTGDEQSDIFSLGVVLHEIITGKLPYLDGAGSSVQGWMLRWRQWTKEMAVADSPICIHPLTMRLLNGADGVVEKALAPSRNERYQTFTAFRQELDEKITFYEQKHAGKTFRRLQFVGKGGFGEVFKARWLEANIDVAIKQLLNLAYASRFHTEAKVMQKLQDSCFVKFIDFFETPDHAFLVMQFLGGMPGSSLRDAINRTRVNGTPNGLPKNLVLPAFERYARGLALMHRQKIIHRDIKPTNLYYPAGRPDLVAIMDFGIVKDADSSTTFGMVPCTLDYAPPEILVTENRGGPGMDIFALGLCMYEALTGRLSYPRLPRGQAGLMALFERCKSFRAPTFDDPKVVGDPELLALLKKMTAPDLSKRFKDADEVAIEIRRLFYRTSSEDDCPPTAVFDPATDQTQPIDEKRLMAWYKEWVKAHPEAMMTTISDLPDTHTPRPPSAGRWKRLVLTGLVSAFVSVGGMLAAPYIQRFWAPPPAPESPLPTPRPTVPTPPAPQSEPTAVLDLKRQLFERDFAESLADEPVETRRMRLANGTNILAQARKDKLYVDEQRWTNCETRLQKAASAVVGKIKNVCGCDLKVDDIELTVGETRLFKFADGVCRKHRMRIFGYDVRTVPEQLDGRTLEIKKDDFVVSNVEVALPKLEPGTLCYFEGRQTLENLSLKPGTYQCEYRRHGYESQKLSFTVELGKGTTLPSPQKWEPSQVEVSLPKLGTAVTAKFDDKVISGPLKLLPGKYKIVYERGGYVQQVCAFEVLLATPSVLPSPGKWQVARVRVTVPDLPSAVTCRIDGSPCTTSVELLPGNHQSEFTRKGFATISNSFTVVQATPLVLTAPKVDAWRVLPVLVSWPRLPDDFTLSIGGDKQPRDRMSCSLIPQSYTVQFARAGYQSQSYDLKLVPGQNASITLPAAQTWVPLPRPKPHPALRLEVKPQPKPEIKPQPVPPVTYSPEVLDYVKQAKDYFGFAQYDMTVEFFSKAVQKGYRLSADEMNECKTAFETRLEELNKEIKRLENGLEIRGNRDHRSIEKYRLEKRQLIEMYQAIERACRTT